ncbi:hypothetical protein CJU89_6599 [Yarrowia sp. B02]|nr:hypothetical protein CJU89_6599 [Yarrowia sp. B02]
MEDPPKKKRKFVVLKRRQDVLPSASPETPNDDIYDQSAHITVKPVSVEIKADPVVEVVKETVKQSVKEAKPRTRATRSKSQQEVVELDDDTPEDVDSDSDIDPDKELQEALARARRLKEEKEQAEALLRAENEVLAAEEAVPEPVVEEPIKRKKPKVYRGEKVCFRLSFPAVDGHKWKSVIFTTRSLIPFHEIQEKLTQILYQRCAEDDVYPPPEHELEQYILVLRGSRIFRNSTCQTMGITTRDENNCPEVQWLNKEDAEKFKKRGMEEEEVVEEYDDVDVGDVSISPEPVEEEPEEPEEEELELRMTGKDKKTIAVRVGISRQFVKLAEHYAREQNVPAASVQLYFDGDLIDLSSRIEDADVEDEDMLEVRLV